MAVNPQIRRAGLRTWPATAFVLCLPVIVMQAAFCQIPHPDQPVQAALERCEVASSLRRGGQRSAVASGYPATAERCPPWEIPRLSGLENIQPHTALEQPVPSEAPAFAVLAESALAPNPFAQWQAPEGAALPPPPLRVLPQPTSPAERVESAEPAESPPVTLDHDGRLNPQPLDSATQSAGGRWSHPRAHDESNTSAGYGFELPFISRNFSPERSTLKLGPAYLDIVSVSAGLLYSEYRALDPSSPDLEDGWLAFSTLDFRVVVPLGKFSLVAGAELYYLPFSGEVGLATGDAGRAGLKLIASYEEVLGVWRITLSDRLETLYRLDNELSQPAVEEVASTGHYRFTRNEPIYSRSFTLDGADGVILQNTISATASGLLTPQIRLTSRFAREDRTDTADLDSGNSRGTTYAAQFAEYAGDQSPLTPFSGYLVSKQDNDPAFLHQAFIGIKGPLTDQLSIFARFGEAWTTNDDDNFQRPQYELGLIHVAGPYTQHSLFGGSVISESDFGDRQEGRYLRYTLNQVLGPQLTGALFGQWSDSSYLDSSSHAKSLLGGITLREHLDRRTELEARASYRISERDPESDDTRFRCRVAIHRQLHQDLTLSLSYQFERLQLNDESGGYVEHLYALRLIKLF